MTVTELAERIAALEWPMFHSVNGEERADCQDDKTGFLALRKAQFSTWSLAAAQSYLDDLERAGAEGRNLAREKYIRMMASTDPEGYEVFKNELPAVSAEKEELVEKIWGHFLVQTEKMREKFPAVALGGRPLRAAEEQDGWASIETYQKGELLTYSEKTLEALLAHVEELEDKGVDLAFEIQKNSVTCMGFASLEEAEKAMAFQFIQAMGGGECTTCGAYGDMS